MNSDKRIPNPNPGPCKKFNPITITLPETKCPLCYELFDPKKALDGSLTILNCNPDSRANPRHNLQKWRKFHVFHF